jgi:hypothetical protein
MSPAIFLLCAVLCGLLLLFKPTRIPVLMILGALLLTWLMWAH